MLGESSVEGRGWCARGGMDSVGRKQKGWNGETGGTDTMQAGRVSEWEERSRDILAIWILLRSF